MKMLKKTKANNMYKRIKLKLISEHESTQHCRSTSIKEIIKPICHSTDLRTGYKTVFILDSSIYAEFIKQSRLQLYLIM